MIVQLLDDGVTGQYFGLLHHHLAVQEAADDGKQALPQETAARSKDCLAPTGSRPFQNLCAEQPKLSPLCGDSPMKLQIRDC